MLNEKIGVILQLRKESFFQGSKLFNYYWNFDYKGRSDFRVVILVNRTLFGFANLTKPYQETLNVLIKTEGNTMFAKLLIISASFYFLRFERKTK